MRGHCGVATEALLVAEALWKGRRLMGAERTRHARAPRSRQPGPRVAPVEIYVWGAQGFKMGGRGDVMSMPQSSLTHTILHYPLAFV